MGRAAERTKYRVPCTLTIDGRRHKAFVLDFSSTGLFIQTSAKAEPGQRLDLELMLRGKKLWMHVEVARRKRVPPQLLTVAHGGVGVRILSAPEEFYQLLTENRGPNTGGEAGFRATGGRSAKPGSPAQGGPTGGSAAPGGTRPVGAKPAAPRTGPEFRVRLKQCDGARTRTLRIQAADEAAARLASIEEVGEGWKVLEVERV